MEGNEIADLLAGVATDNAASAVQRARPGPGTEDLCAGPIGFAGYKPINTTTVSYGHRTMNTRLPVRSAIFKHRIARLVLQWVTMRESRVL